MTEQLRMMSELDCLRVLHSHKWGRVAMTVDGWPEIFPVNYAFEADSIVFRTGEGMKLDAAPSHPVAFELDEADADGDWGWSVVVQGPAFDITDCVDETSRRLQRLPIDTWAPGEKHHLIRISAVHVSGRAFGSIPALALLAR